jgi:predicted ArsR family transcriptional regulator
MTRTGHIALGKFLALLLGDEPSTVDDISEHSGLSPQTIRSYIRTWRKEGIIFVAAWEEDTRGRMTHKAYQLGRSADVPRPRVRLSPAERARRQRERRRQERMLSALNGGTRHRIPAPAACQQPEAA